MNTLLNVKTFLMVGFCFTVCLLSSCKDSETEVGINLQPDKTQYVVRYDTVTKMKAFTYQQNDTIRINPLRTVLGYLNDPRFGSFEYSFMSEIRSITKANINDTTIIINPIGDSVCVNLSVTGFYGIGDSPQLVEVYELKNEMVLESIEGTFNNPTDLESITGEYIKPEKIAEFTFDPKKLNDSTYYSDSELLSFKLPDTYIEKLITKRTLFEDDVNFKDSVLRGFYFKANGHSMVGAGAYINLIDSYLSLHYHDQDSSDSYEHVFTMALRSKTIDGDDTTFNQCSNCNIYGRTYSFDHPITIHQPLTDPDTSQTDDYVYLKENNSLETRFHITNLNHWKDSGTVFINKAELEIPVDFPLDDRALGLYPKTNLYMSIDTNTTITQGIDYLNDYTVELTYSNTSKSFKIDLTQTIEDRIEDGIGEFFITLQTNDEFYDYTTNRGSNNIGAERVVLCSPKHQTKPARLRIVYTKI